MTSRPSNRESSGRSVWRASVDVVRESGGQTLSRRRRGPRQLRAFETLTLDGVVNGIGMDAQFTGNGADLPMLGVKITANPCAGFVTDHEKDHLRLGMRAYGSTKRPTRPQIEQCSVPTG